MSNRSKRHGESDKDEWQTPDELIRVIDRGLDGIDTDPCAGEDTEIGDRWNYTKSDDGLIQPWYGRVFVNPPFTQKEIWLRKGIRQVRVGNAKTVVFITPDSTDAKKWWHQYIAEESEIICLHAGRVDYIDPEKGEEVSGVPFGTAISVFGEVPDALLDELQEIGHVVTTVTDGKTNYNTKW